MVILFGNVQYTRKRQELTQLTINNDMWVCVPFQVAYHLSQTQHWCWLLRFLIKESWNYWL